MPQLTPECDRIIVFGYQTSDPTRFIAEDFFKVALMTLEILSIEDYSLSTIFIFDFKNYTLGHAPKITLPLSKKCETCTMVCTDSVSSEQLTKYRQCVIRTAKYRQCVIRTAD
jgi:predicted transglutaminase-like protease